MNLQIPKLWLTRELLKSCSLQKKRKTWFSKGKKWTESPRVKPDWIRLLIIKIAEAGGRAPNGGSPLGSSVRLAVEHKWRWTDGSRPPQSSVILVVEHKRRWTARSRPLGSLVRLALSAKSTSLACFWPEQARNHPISSPVPKICKRLKTRPKRCKRRTWHNKQLKTRTKKRT